MSDVRAWHPLQENEAKFSPKYFSKTFDQIFEKGFYYNFALLAVKCY